METRTRGKGTIDRGLRGSVGTLADANPTKLSKRSQGCPLTKLVVEGGEELSDIKGKNTRVALSEPSHPDKMSEVSKSGTAQPTWCLPLIIYSLGEVITVPLAQILTSGMITFWFIF